MFMIGELAVEKKDFSKASFQCWTASKFWKTEEKIQKQKL